MSLKTGCVLMLGLIVGNLINAALTTEASLDRRMTTLQVQTCTKSDRKG